MVTSKEKRMHLLKAVSIDEIALELLSASNSTENRSAFAARLAELLPAFVWSPRDHAPEAKWRKFAAWASDKTLTPSAITAAMNSRKSKSASQRTRKRDLIRELGLDWSDSCSSEFLEALPVKYVTRLKTPYPAHDKWVCESKSIRAQWAPHLRRRKEADIRIRKRPCGPVVRNERLQYIVAADESVVLRDRETNELVAVVIRDFCPSKEAVKWADGVVKAAMPVRKGIRKQDAGTLLQMGYSAGSRNPMHARFDWVRNILSAQHTATDISEMDRQESSVFALLWQLTQKRMLPEVTADIEDWMARTGIWRMDGNGTLSEGTETGKYFMSYGGEILEFWNQMLPPPCGVYAENYAKVIHFERQPHKFSIAWTLTRNQPPDSGGNFFLAAYGIKIEAAANTVHVWNPNELHGTGLPDFDPEAYCPSDPDMAYMQRGLAFVTGDRINRIWDAYQARQMTNLEASAAYNDFDDY